MYKTRKQETVINKRRMRLLIRTEAPSAAGTRRPALSQYNTRAGNLQPAARAVVGQFDSNRGEIAGWRRAELCGGTITLKKLGAVISATGEELQVSGRKMTFVGGHDQR